MRLSIATFSRRAMLAIVVASVAAWSCAAHPSNASQKAGDSRARGFSDAFPDPSVLLSTRDVAQTRALLEATTIPESAEHHDMLVRLLSGVGAVDADHLLLLTRAVAPGITRIRPGSSLTINGVRIDSARSPRGTGPFTETVDKLLLEGALKLGDLNPTNAGRLLGTAEKKATVIALADRFLPKVDDGSARALQEILAGFDSSDQSHKSPTDLAVQLLSNMKLGPSAKSEFVQDVLLARGLLNGDRETLAFKSLDESELVKILCVRFRDAESPTIDLVRRYLGLLSSDAERSSFLEEAAQRLGTIEVSSVVDLVRTIANESSRVSSIQSLGAHLKEGFGVEGLLAFCDSVTTDSSRLDIMKALAPRVRLSAADLKRCASRPSSDSYRFDAVNCLRPRVDGVVDFATIQSLVQLLASDSYRFDLIQFFHAELIEAKGAIDADLLLGFCDLVRSDSYRLEVMKYLSSKASLSAKDLARCASRMSSDSYRFEAVNCLRPRVDGAVDFATIQSLVQLLASDSYRFSLLQSFRAELIEAKGAIDADLLLGFCNLVTSDSYRLELMKYLSSKASLSAKDLIRCVSRLSSDSMKFEAMTAMHRRVAESVDSATIRSIIDVFRGDAYRLEVIEHFKGELASVAPAEKEEIVNKLAGKAYRSDARRVLGLQN